MIGRLVGLVGWFGLVGFIDGVLRTCTYMNLFVCTILAIYLLLLMYRMTRRAASIDSGTDRGTDIGINLGTNSGTDLRTDSGTQS